MCAQAQYALNPGVALDEKRYAVEVKARSIDLFLQVKADDLDGYTAAFQEKYAQTDPAALNDEAQAAFWSEYENDWAMGIINLCQEKLPLLGYSEVETILVLVAPDSKGNYGMGDNDFANLSTLILPY